MHIVLAIEPDTVTAYHVKNLRNLAAEERLAFNHLFLDQKIIDAVADDCNTTSGKVRRSYRKFGETRKITVFPPPSDDDCACLIAYAKGKRDAEAMGITNVARLHSNRKLPAMIRQELIREWKGNWIIKTFPLRKPPATNHDTRTIAWLT